MTYNIDVAYLHNKYNRIIEEVYKSVSSGVTATREADLNRWKKALEDLDEHRDFVVDKPQLDCPETHPKDQALLANPQIGLVENDAVNTFLDILTIGRDELINSQSARLPSGLLEADENRQKSYVDKARELLDFIEDRQPMDFPESSPQKPSSGSGRKGI